jgi:hypothetical protein
VIGLPLPGVSVKLADDPSGKLELRVKGPNVTSGHFNNPLPGVPLFCPVLMPSNAHYWSPGESDSAFLAL